jgi:hypothetical protein
MPPREHTKRAQVSREPSGSGPPPTKKTRFVEPADDSANFAEEVDAALENPSATRKGRVKTDGYDSDSSDDGEGVVLSRRAGADGTAKDDDEDDDMFAAGSKDNDAKKTAAESGDKKGGEEFLRLGDIEGQEFGRGSGDDDGGDESSGDDEPEDEDDAERRKKASFPRTGCTCEISTRMRCTTGGWTDSRSGRSSSPASASADRRGPKRRSCRQNNGSWKNWAGRRRSRERCSGC